MPLLECVHCSSFPYIRSWLIRLTKWGCGALPFPTILIKLFLLPSATHKRSDWMCVWSVHCPLCSFIYYSTQFRAPLETQNSETSVEYEAQRQMQRGTFGTFSSADCIAATASNLRCWWSLGGSCFAMMRESVCSYTASCGDIPPRNTEAFTVSKSQLSVGRYCISVNAELDFSSQGATCKSEDPTFPSASNSLTWKPGFLMQDTRDCPCTMCSSKIFGKCYKKSALISAHQVWNTCIIFQKVTRR